jgi:hypothetical protein
MKSSIQINNTELRIRPSSIDTFNQCPYQWAKVFLEGVTTIPSSRAAIGTGVHKAIEVMWTESMAHNVKEANTDVMVDAGIESFNEEAKKGMTYNTDEDINSCHKEIHIGVDAYVDNLLPFLDIPTAVETRFTVPIADHPIVADISGTVDYLAPGRIDDVKTSKRKPTVANYKTQQSIYKYLAEMNGHPVTHSMIQGVVFTKVPQAMILEAAIDIDQAKANVNSLLDTLEYATKDVVPMDVLFRCNPKYYLCSEKYCSLHGSCPATKRHSPKVEQPKL